MSTYLQLVQQLHEECGAAGVAPATLTGQTGENLRLINWVKSADRYVQQLWHVWKFLRAEFSDTTVISQRDNTTGGTPADLQHWDEESFKILRPGATVPDPLEVYEYNNVRGEIFDTSIEDIPWRVIIMPDNSLRFDPVPDAAYTITADYYKVPVDLAVDADVSAIPEMFHQVIIGRALMLYGNYENAPEIKEQGQEIYTEALGRLESLQLPNQFAARFKGNGGFFEVVAE